ncbi:MAG: sensor domain-containing diguanylate cyclase, partial [Halofilum sp. (in: g-proteobacteria)]
MRSAPLPPDEAERLATLERYAILDTPPDDAFEAIVRVARALFDARIGLVSLIDRDRQWFKVHQGVDLCQTSRDIAFCAHVLHQRAPLYVPDARADVRFDHNELVTHSPQLRFYCGVPLYAPDGSIPGTLDVLDTHPRPDISAEQIARLEDLATAVVTLMESRRTQVRLRVTEPELVLNRELRRLLYERVEFGLAVTDPGGRIEQVNTRMARWVGAGEPVLVGRQLRHWLESATSLGHTREARLRLADGERMPVRHAAERVAGDPDTGGGHVLHTLADLRPERVARALQDGRTDVLGRIARRAEPERTLERIADLPSLADAEAVGYVLVHRDRGAPLALAPGMGRRGAPADARPDALTRALTAVDVLVRDAKSRKPAVLAPLEHYGPDATWLAVAARLRSAIAMPLYSLSQEQAVIGSVGILAPVRHAQPIESLRTELADMSQLVSITLQHSSMLERLRWQAYHDDLTGLGNRTLLRERLAAALDEPPAAERAMVAVFLFDLDGFKQVNDVGGHAAGDRVLREVAERVRGILRSGDVCCRVGGDELVVFTPVAHAEDARRLAGKLMQAAALPARYTG